ncbi:MAG: hypothetical protein JW914_01845 [Syntrophaceae bacterium]|nr:hypothetical protein [Syntrophaceae bacterium]
MKKIVLLLIMFLSFVFCWGCVTMVLKAADMTPQTVPIEIRADKPVKILVEGEGIFGYTAIISNQDFTEALQTSIEKSQLFSGIDKELKDGYLLEVFIISFEPPKGGLNMAATLITHWKLTRLPSNEVIYEDLIKKTCVKTVGDAVSGLERVRITSGCVAQDTISEGIKNISKVKL